MPIIAVQCINGSASLFVTPIDNPTFPIAEENSNIACSKEAPDNVNIKVPIANNDKYNKIKIKILFFSTKSIRSILP